MWSPVLRSITIGCLLGCAVLAHAAGGIGASAPAGHQPAPTLAAPSGTPTEPKAAPALSPEERQGNYYHLIERCGQMHTRRPADDDDIKAYYAREHTANHLALDALRQADDIPLPLVVDLIRCVTPIADMRQDEQLSLRRQLVELHAHALQRLKAEYNPQYDFSDLPLLNLMPPYCPGILVFSGMSPDAIPDPKVRAEYQANIEKNGRHTREFNVQFELRKLASWYPEYVEQTIVAHYTMQEPRDLAELRGLLEKHMPDAVMRARILQRVGEYTPLRFQPLSENFQLILPEPTEDTQAKNTNTSAPSATKETQEGTGDKQPLPRRTAPSRPNK